MKINGYEIKPFADLKGADLRGADLEGAILVGADLEGAILVGANVTGTILEKKEEPQKELYAKEPKETTITKEQLDSLWNALEYTRATISGGKDMMGKLDCFAINKGRAHQSESFLNAAIDLVNQLKKELQ